VAFCWCFKALLYSIIGFLQRLICFHYYSSELFITSHRRFSILLIGSFHYFSSELFITSHRSFSLLLIGDFQYYSSDLFITSHRSFSILLIGSFHYFSSELSSLELVAAIFCDPPSFFQRLGTK
jgi:hypothetical protein